MLALTHFTVNPLHRLHHAHRLLLKWVNDPSVCIVKAVCRKKCWLSPLTLLSAWSSSLTANQLISFLLLSSSAARGRTNLELREKFILPEGAAQGLTAFRSRGRRSKPSSRTASPTRSSSSASHSAHSCASLPSAPATPTASSRVSVTILHSIKDIIHTYCLLWEHAYTNIFMKNLKVISLVINYIYTVILNCNNISQYCFIVFLLK